ncbi:MAG TPA: hypothetical protein VMV27_10095, partial [Candidatus Binataceae bacterium]|nr:hypothetical protein [Candidatus Binataceae bacterium]
MRANREARKAMRCALVATMAMAVLAIAVSGSAYAQVKPGDVITKANAAQVQNLVSPGNYTLVQRG